MNRTDYLNAVSEFFYQGEVLGEAFFATYVAREKDPVRRYKWGTLMQLETETKALLRPFLVRLGLGVEQADVTARIAAYADGFDAKPWRQHMEEIADITGFFLEKFRAIEAAAPEDEVATARYMIEHETALHRFARLEMSGDTTGSLADVVGQLRWPLPLVVGQ
jgi:hypothetical protein